jgi:hypothetical protein
MMFAVSPAARSILLQDPHSRNLDFSVWTADRVDGAQGWGIIHTEAFAQRFAFHGRFVCEFSIDFCGCSRDCIAIVRCQPNSAQFIDSIAEPNDRVTRHDASSPRR